MIDFKPINIFLLTNLQTLILTVLISIVVYLAINYLIKYRSKAKKIQRMLAQHIDKVNAVKSLSNQFKRSKLDEIFKNSELMHNWQEYQETLHNQYESNEAQQVLIKTRSTVPSSIYFTQEGIIDTPLGVEYFKHLPGILTGIGIIGTFAGLLIGLNGFDITNPALIDESVKELLQAVEHAFIASCVAITVSMFITYDEKSQLRKCITLIDELIVLIDSQFDAGVGEEYLSDLVKHTQENSAQTRMLKDSLVNDLQTMLKNLVDEQAKQNLSLSESLAKSYKEASEYTAEKISESVKDSLSGPLQKIAESVQTASGDQTDKVQKLLTDVISSFQEQIESTFGNQFEGMQEMMGKSVAAIEQMQSGFGQLIQDMKESSVSSTSAIQDKLLLTLEDMNRSQSLMQAGMQEMLLSLDKAVVSIGSQGESAGSLMAEQITKLFNDSELRQKALADQMQNFIDGIKTSIDKGQQDSMDKVYQSVAQLEGKFEEIFESFKESRSAMDKDSKVAQAELQSEALKAVNGVNDLVKELLQGLQQERSAANDFIKAIGEHTQNSLKSMQLGADKMSAAADRFSSAGESLSGVALDFEDMLSKVKASSVEMTMGLSHLSNIVNDYKLHREAAQKTLATIESVVTSSQIESTQRVEMLEQLKLVSKEMERNNQQAVEYLENINNVLTNSFNAFGDGVNRTLTKVLGTLDQDLDKAVQQMSSNFSELGENIQDLSDSVEKSIIKN